MWKAGLCYQLWRVFFPLNKANRSLLQFASCLASSPGTEMTFRGWVSPARLRHHRGRSRAKAQKDLLFSQSTASSLIKSLANSCKCLLSCLFFCVAEIQYDFPSLLLFTCCVGHGLEMHVIFLFHFLLSRKISLLLAWSFSFQEQYIGKLMKWQHIKRKILVISMWSVDIIFLSWIESNCQIIGQNFNAPTC